ncbi:hypothetical protein NDU88_002880 [Pleurodeles waltl]|uniref:Uncharacterized protein n=1 Tax=Pleurodeles waltl TaxID=8319 RepID=A0AAV7W5U3_PLEWA|nr:hypothetical protein NDU88_002880 [Pleurodeles waltl]
MSAKSKGTPSSPAEEQASKTKVKEQIKTIVDDLELVLGDLKDVAKELKEVRRSSLWDLGRAAGHRAPAAGAGLGQEVGFNLPWTRKPLHTSDHYHCNILNYRMQPFPRYLERRRRDNDSVKLL